MKSMLITCRARQVPSNQADRNTLSISISPETADCSVVFWAARSANRVSQLLQRQKEQMRRLAYNKQLGVVLSLENERPRFSAAAVSIRGGAAPSLCFLGIWIRLGGAEDSDEPPLNISPVTRPGRRRSGQQAEPVDSCWFDFDAPSVFSPPSLLGRYPGACSLSLNAQPLIMPPMQTLSRCSCLMAARLFLFVSSPYDYCTFMVGRGVGIIPGICSEREGCSKSQRWRFLFVSEYETM